MVQGMNRSISFLAEAGDPLLPARSIFEVHDRLEDLPHLSGLTPDRTVVSYLSSVPLPRYERRQPGDPRWVGLKAPALACPIFWIPDDVADRYPVADVAFDGGMRAETDDEWAARMALIFVSSGLYDPVDGTWVDVPARLGYDLEDEAVRGRFQEWLDGGVDDELDQLDATALFPQGTEQNIGMYDAVQEAMPGLMALSRYIGFGDVNDRFEAIYRARADLDVEDVREHLLFVLALAQLVAQPLGDEQFDRIVEEARDNVTVCSSTDELLGFAITHAVNAVRDRRSALEAEAIATIERGEAVLAEQDPSLAEDQSAPEG